MIKSENLVETLRGHSFLEGFQPQHIEKLASLAHEVHFDRDQIIFREGDESSFFYLILSGKVSLEVTAMGRTLRVLTLAEGEELGWSSTIPTRGKHFQARALTSVKALAFDGARMREACEEDYAFGYALMKRMMSVVDGRLQAFRLQLLDMYSPSGSKPQ